MTCNDAGQCVFEWSLGLVLQGTKGGAVFLLRLSEVDRMSVEEATDDTGAGYITLHK